MNYISRYLINTFDLVFLIFFYVSELILNINNLYWFYKKYKTFKLFLKNNTI